ncbi:MAG: hypothetical protein B6D37_15235 [Sphingobacteriales bacterium UTBCD1]|jgi:hypothetical protein|nr:MAG: hypothetical protein B6D37_15235 [Sphingobacteriales bacterium UTBCD1]
MWRNEFCLALKSSYILAVSTKNSEKLPYRFQNPDTLKKLLPQSMVICKHFVIVHIFLTQKLLPAQFFKL